MHQTGTLFSYLARQYGFWLVSVFLALTALFGIFDFVELLRRASNKADLPFEIIVQMSLTKLPQLIEVLFPFMILFGSLIAFWRLAKSNELIVIRAAGFSAWQALLPALVVAFVVGVFQVTAYSPLAASLNARFEQLENKYLEVNDSQLSVSQTGLWLRQKYEGGQAVIHAVKTRAGGTRLRDVTVYLFSDQNTFNGRIDAKRAVLNDNRWDLSEVLVSNPNGTREKRAGYTLPTNLTEKRIADSFASADSLSFWRLPSFIRTLEEAGFNTTEHRLRFHSLLSKPLLFCAMVLIAATFSFQATRRASTSYMILGGIMCGFLLYLLTNVVHALGLATGLPVPLAAWMPAGVSIMLGITALLHMEDG